MDSELSKIEFALSSRQKRTNGFEGCANYGNGCDFAGFYTCTYSKEGLCDACELKQFPERYHGCCFCRKSISHGRMCHGCYKGFEKWLTNLFCDATAQGDWRFRQTVEQGIFRLTNDSSVKKLPWLIQQLANYDHEWPGFHLGELKWINIDPFPLQSKINIKDINWNNVKFVFERELNKLGIHLHEERQISFLPPVIIHE